MSVINITTKFSRRVIFGLKKQYGALSRSVIHGFTIIELLIVIVVVAILAAITIVSYAGIQDRARSTQRAHDISSIAKAIELYKIQYGQIPPAQGNLTSGWESSAINPDDFLSILRTSGVVSDVPVDPVNEAPGGATSSTYEVTSYLYYVYPAGYAGCDASRGEFYVIMVHVVGKFPAPDSPGFACGTFDANDFDPYWAIGGFES